MEPDCRTDVRTELADWQMKLDKIVEKLDAAPCGDKANVLPQITDLYILREELKDKIEALEGECNVPEEQERRRIEEEPSVVVRPIVPACGFCC